MLDAGCGSGSASRLFAITEPSAKVIGVDQNASYIAYATNEATKQGLDNVGFQVANVLDLPFADHSFDLVWSKHLLQWVRNREDALKEFVRVTRPGGRIVCSNFDGFCLQHYPVDPQVQHDLETWFTAAKESFGFDCFLGRKLPSLFKTAGLTDIKVDIMADKAFCGFGGDSERAWNWEQQWQSALPFSVEVFGSQEHAAHVTERLLKHFNNPDVFTYTSLFYVEGRVP